MHQIHPRLQVNCLQTLLDCAFLVTLVRACEDQFIENFAQIHDIVDQGRMGWQIHAMAVCVDQVFELRLHEGSQHEGRLVNLVHFQIVVSVDVFRLTRLLGFPDQRCVFPIEW